MMSRIFRWSGIFILILSLFLLAGCGKEVPQKVFTVGVINYSPAAEPSFGGFKEGMAKLGYVEGENIRYLYKGYIRDKEMLAEEGKFLMRAKVDLIFSLSTPATLVAKEVSVGSKVPVVFGPVSNPVGSGLVKNLKHPGGNLTGVTFSYQEPKRLELLQRVAPTIKRVGFPYNPNDKSPMLNLTKIRAAAQKLDLVIVPFPLPDNSQINAFLKNFPKNIDAVFLPTDSLMASRVKDFSRVAIEKMVPLSPPQREGVFAGGLLSYGFSLEDIGRQAARLADQVLQGVPPADLPVEVCEFVMTINLKTAHAIGVSVPDSILRQAIVIRD